jgi:hypothetical protein
MSDVLDLDEIEKKINKIDWQTAIIKQINQETKKEQQREEQRHNIQLLKKDLGRRH